MTETNTPPADLHLFKSDTDTVSALSADDAREVWFDQTGERASDYPDLVFLPIDDDKAMAFGDEDVGTTETKTAREWALSSGRGVVASTEY